MFYVVHRVSHVKLKYLQYEFKKIESILAKIKQYK